MNTLNIAQAVACLQQGKIIAYPTEAVFGLGCCPHNHHALQNLVTLKARASSKGFILIGSEIDQILPFIEISTISASRWQEIQCTWPGPYTWVFPVASNLSPLLHGEYTSVAVRVTNHPVARALCAQFGRAIVSTSANLTQQLPSKEAMQVQQLFGHQIAGIVHGEIGESLQPTIIQDALTGKIYRS